MPTGSNLGTFFWGRTSRWREGRLEFQTKGLRLKEVREACPLRAFNHTIGLQPPHDRGDRKAVVRRS